MCRGAHRGGSSHRGLCPPANSAAGASERLFELLDTRPEIEDSPDAVDLPMAQGAVAFEGVSFSYEPGKSVLRDISFATHPGETIAEVRK